MAIYSHMCRMDHEEIGFNTESKTCPLCRSMDGCDQLNRENASLRARVTTLEDLLGRVTEQLVARLGTNSSEWATVLEVRRTLNP